MKMKYMAALWLLIAESGHSQDRVMYSAGKKQELLAPAASCAIEDQNIEMLDILEKAGWDPSVPIGHVPGDLELLPYTPMTFAALTLNEKVLRWLIHDAKIPLDGRDAYLERAIDVVLDDDDFANNDANQLNAVIRLLARDVKPLFSEVMEELACNAIPKFGGRPCLLKEVNGAPPAGEWLKFDACFSKFQKLSESKKKAIHHSPRDIETRPLSITWKEADNGDFHFHITEADSEWSGGTSGVIYSKYGYWLTKDRKSYDG